MKRVTVKQPLREVVIWGTMIPVFDWLLGACQIQN